MPSRSFIYFCKRQELKIKILQNFLKKIDNNDVHFRMARQHKAKRFDYDLDKFKFTTKLSYDILQYANTYNKRIVYTEKWDFFLMINGRHTKEYMTSEDCTIMQETELVKNKNLKKRLTYLLPRIKEKILESIKQHQLKLEGKITEQQDVTTRAERRLINEQNRLKKQTNRGKEKRSLCEKIINEKKDIFMTDDDLECLREFVYENMDEDTINEITGKSPISLAEKQRISKQKLENDLQNLKKNMKNAFIKFGTAYFDETFDTCIHNQKDSKKSVFRFDKKIKVLNYGFNDYLIGRWFK